MQIFPCYFQHKESTVNEKFCIISIAYACITILSSDSFWLSEQMFKDIHCQPNPLIRLGDSHIDRQYDELFRLQNLGLICLFSMQINQCKGMLWFFTGLSYFWRHLKIFSYAWFLILVTTTMTFFTFIGIAKCFKILISIMGSAFYSDLSMGQDWT